MLARAQQHWFVRNWKWLFALGIAAISICWFLLHLSFHPGYIDEDKQEAAALIVRFHRQMNTGSFDETYDEADIALRNALSREDWRRHMLDTKETFGRFNSPRTSQLNVIIGAPVQIRAVYVSQFEKSDATELFSFVRRGDRILLLAYGIYPGDRTKPSPTPRPKSQ